MHPAATEDHQEQVILVDEDDREIGTAPKLDAHRTGALHRAFSVFVFDRLDTLLLQKRARAKYHSGGRWTNTCCGHPRPGETVVAAARRRLREEMGFVCDLVPVGTFTYRVSVGDRLEEHELDHVLIGRYEGVPLPDPREVEAWRRIPVSDLLRALSRAPDEFTAWFPLALAVALRGDRVPDAMPAVAGGQGVVKGENRT